MDRPEGIEFLNDGGDAGPFDEDVIDFGRARAPRWILIITVVAAVAVAATAIATHVHGSHPAAQLAPIESTSPTTRTTPALNVFPPFVGSALSIGPTAAVDVSVIGSRLYVLQVGRISVVDVHSGNILAWADVGDSTNGSALRLVADPTGSRIWVITVNTSPAQITAFDARSLKRLRATTWHSVVRSAAVLDGSLYLQSRGVAVMGPADSAPHLVAALAQETGAIAADALRHRLLVLRIGPPSHVITYSPGGEAHLVPTALDVVKADLAVIDGHVWLGGFGPAGAELEQLDAMTFAPGRNNPLYDFLGAGALLVARGAHVVWVRASSGQLTSGLSCIDATTGKEVRSWFQVEGQVASGGGRAYLANGAAVLPLELGPCRG